MMTTSNINLSTDNEDREYGDMKTDHGLVRWGPFGKRFMNVEHD
jgi:hypothetical protein